MRTTIVRPLSPSASSSATPHRRSARGALVAASFCTALAFPSLEARAAVLAPTSTRVTAPDSAAFEALGKSVALQDDIAAIGAPVDGDAGAGAGAVFIFRRTGTTWTQEAKLLGQATTDNFGTSVSLSGTRLIVGAPNAANSKGAAYVYTRIAPGNWGVPTTLHTLASPVLVDRDAFGQAVAISGNTAIVGAPGDTTTGVAYVFRLNATWAQDGTRLAGSVAQGKFGQAVAVDADFAIVGSKGVTAGRGAASVFQRVTTPAVSWGTGTALSAPIADFDRFGDSVAISGTWALIGAPGSDGGPEDAGGVYFFQRSGTTWTASPRFNSPNPTEFGEFGVSVSLSGSRALVGAPNESGGNGRVYVLAQNGTTWSLAQPALSSISTNGYFGASTSLSNTGEAIVGAMGESCFGGQDCGAAYLFTSALPAVPLLGVPAALALTALLGACGGLVLRRRTLARG